MTQAWALSLTLISALLWGASASAAAPPPMFIDGQVGLGLEMGEAGGETQTRRGPVFIALEGGYTFDPLYDAQFDLEGFVHLDEARVGLAPGVRLTRGGPSLRYFVGAKAPWIIRPASLFGGRLLSGIVAPLGGVSMIAQMQADAYFAGSDLPEDGAFIALNWSLGARLDL